MPEVYRLLHAHYDWAVVSTLPPGQVVRFVLHAAEKEMETLARPMWYLTLIGTMLDKRKEPISYSKFMGSLKKQRVPEQRSAEEIMAELMPLAEKARTQHG